MSTTSPTSTLLLNRLFPPQSPPTQTKMRHISPNSLSILISSIIFALVRPTWADDSWPTLSSERAIAVRSQRDVSANITLDQLSLTGIALSPTVFRNDGYTLDSLTDVRDLLDLGVQILEVDIYWHEQLHKFQLCPAPMTESASSNTTANFTTSNGETYSCQTSLTLSNLTQTVQSYISDSDTNLSANLIILIFNMFSISQSNETSGSMGTSNDTLSHIMTNYFGSSLYTPALLQFDRSSGVTYDLMGNSSTGWPTLSNFLFTEKKRVIAVFGTEDLPSNTTYDPSTDTGTVFSTTTFNNTISAEAALSPTSYTSSGLLQWRIAVATDFDNDSTSETLSDLVSMGFSPVINSSALPTLSSNIPTLLNDSLWTWSSSQPLTDEDARLKAEASGITTAQAAYNCASIPMSGSKWEVSNCYDEKPVACRLQSSNGSIESFQWALTVDKFSYFHAGEACDSLPGSAYVSSASSESDESIYLFSVPKTSLEQRALVSLANSADLNSTDMWIDMNCIAISNCWVTGGPYASCPYQKVSSHRNFVEMLTPAVVFCGVIFFCILLLRLRRVPLHDNRKHWKKLINEYTQNEYEGVPS